MNTVEVIGFIAGVVGVWLEARQNIWCWGVNLINVVVYGFIFFRERLFADMGLHILYLFLTLYGWYQWSAGGDKKKGLPISHISWKESVLILAVTILFACMLGYCLQRWTNADLPYWDALLSSSSVAATWLMARKYIECWPLWILTDGAYVVLYASKQLYATALLSFIITCLAAYAWVEWSKKMPTSVTCTV